ncbi:hypothetical protein [Rhodomicrobium sp.]|uniref:hypothetical protein n=1 Tax=Rhodomicrobium sp. TaxID=2720632 RepID=UPI0039E6D1F5
MNAEGEDEDPSAEGEDDEPAAEGEEEPKTRKAKAKAARVERARCAGITNLAKQAKRLGVRFDAAKAIANGTNLSVARARVLAAAAATDAGEIDTITRRGSQGATRRSLTKDAKLATWKKALKR